MFAAKMRGDVVLISGDVSNGTHLLKHLEMFEAAGAHALFVLGNHDFYGSSIKRVRGSLWNVSGYLTNLEEPTTIASDACVIGHDGWYDARNGDYWRTTVELADFGQIEDFRNTHQREVRLPVIEKLADEAVTVLRRRLVAATAEYAHVVLVTHVPPYAAAATYRGKVSDEQFQPFFSCRAAGEMLDEVMASRPECRLTVLCGHSHGENTMIRAVNIVVHTAGATYGKPEIQQAWNLEIG